MSGMVLSIIVSCRGRRGPASQSAASDSSHKGKRMTLTIADIGSIIAHHLTSGWFVLGTTVGRQ
eukprot:10908147-Karenia_brevis.AAC.1